MEDRGEKIVNLAREMLSTSRYSDGFNPYETDSKSFTFKTLLLTAFLTAFGSSFVTHWINEIRRPITHYERVELEALVYYISRSQAKDEDQILQSVKNELKITNFNNVTVADYKRALDLLRRQIP